MCILCSLVRFTTAQWHRTFQSNRIAGKEVAQRVVDRALTLAMLDDWRSLVHCPFKKKEICKQRELGRFAGEAVTKRFLPRTHLVYGKV